MPDSVLEAGAVRPAGDEAGAAEEAAGPGVRQRISPEPAAQGPAALIAFLGYVVLMVPMTWPVAANLFTQVPGGGDAWQHIWNLWWVRHSLIDLGANPYYTDLLYYPDGTNLYFHTLVLTAGLASIPLQLAGVNLIGCYNLVLLSTYPLAGLGTFLLCRYLTGSSWASFVGGAVFAFAPYHSAHLFGHMNLASLQWIPFYALLLLKAFGVRGSNGVAEGRDAQQRPHSLAGSFTRGRAMYALGAGALLALNAYTEWTYSIFLVMLTAMLVAWRVMLPSERRELREEGGGVLHLLAQALIVAVAFVVLTAPLLFPTLQEAGKGYAQQPPEETLFYSADLSGAFLPSELHPLWGGEVAEFVKKLPPYLPLKNPSERVLTVGYVAILVALAVAWRLRRDRRVLFWGAAGLAAWALSLGPILQVLGKSHFTAFGVTVPLPYLLLTKLPLLNIMRTPARLSVLVMLAVAVLVAFALAEVARRTRPGWGWRRAMLLAIPVAILFEYLAVFPMVPPGWNVPIYSRVAQEPGRFALLELPIRPFGDYMAYQTIHGKPIIGGYLSRQPPYPLLDKNATVRYLLEATAADGPEAIEVGGGEGVASLKSLGVRYIIIRWWAFTPEQRDAMSRKLANLLARPPDLSFPGDQVDVWVLSP